MLFFLIFIYFFFYLSLSLSIKKSLKGIRPDLKLKTADGATLLETDPLSLIQCLAEENLINSEIISWKLPPLSTRYLEACIEFKSGMYIFFCIFSSSLIKKTLNNKIIYYNLIQSAVDSEISDILENNRAGISLDLSNQNLTPTIAQPIFRALRHQTSLMHLDLSSNFIQDAGLKHLTETLITLKNLTFLDLSGNMLTDDGIEKLCDTLIRSTTLQEIRQLKLNFNPIQSAASLRHVSKMCCQKSIRSLSLISCELVSVSEMETMNTVKDIEIAHNHLTYDGFKELLRKLNPTIVESLNFERCSIAANLGDLIVEFITSGCQNKLKEINLAGLNLSENDILNILRNLGHCENVRMINLSYQHELTFVSLKYILLSMNNRNMKVNLIGCQNLQSTTNMLNLQTFDQSPVIHPCQILLSVPNSFTATMKNEYVTYITEKWNVVTRSRGFVHIDKNIINLSCEQISFL
jgi:Leucine Rich repeat